MELREAFALCGVMIAVVIDIKRRRVPNWLTVPMIVCGIGLALWEDQLIGLKGAGAGFLLALGLFIIPFAAGWLGGGDVKLYAALGTMLGVQAIIWIALYSALAGGLIALVLIVYRQLKAGEFIQQLKHLFWAGYLRLGGTVGKTGATAAVPVLPSTQAALRERYPYTLAIAAGTVAVLFL